MGNVRVFQLARDLGLSSQEVIERLVKPGGELKTASSSVDGGPAGRAAELARQAREHLAIDRDAAPFHARQHRWHRAFQRLVDGGDMFGGEPGLERVP